MNNNRNAAPARKPFCKVCHDAGKPESEYTSHYVKSLPDKRTGICQTTCPTLLNTECRYCYELGHTAKFCPAIAARKKTEERAHREEERRATQKPAAVKPKAPTNAYNALYIDSDDEADTPTQTPAVKEEWPTLGEPSKRVEMGGGYAAAAAMPVINTIPIKETPLPSGFQVLKKGAVYEKTEAPKPTFERTKITSWADWDTDDDEEEEQRYEAECGYNSDW